MKEMYEETGAKIFAPTENTPFVRNRWSHFWKMYEITGAKRKYYTKKMVPKQLPIGEAHMDSGTATSRDM